MDYRLLTTQDDPKRVGDYDWLIFRVSGGQTVAVGQAIETDSAFAVGHFKTVQVGLAAETDTAFAIGHSKTVQLGQSIETDSALPVGVVRPYKAYPVSDDAVGGNIRNHLMATSPIFSELDEDPDTQPDGGYVWSKAGLSGTAWLGMTDPPLEFESAYSLFVKVYKKTIATNGVNSTGVRARAYNVDRVTPYSNTAFVHQGTAQDNGSVVTVELSLNAAGLAAARADWVDWVLRLDWQYS